jgi:hypothetical protein
LEGSGKVNAMLAFNGHVKPVSSRRDGKGQLPFFNEGGYSLRSTSITREDYHPGLVLLKNSCVDVCSV